MLHPRVSAICTPEKISLLGSPDVNPSYMYVAWRLGQTPRYIYTSRESTQIVEMLITNSNRRFGFAYIYPGSKASRSFLC